MGSREVSIPTDRLDGLAGEPHEYRMDVVCLNRHNHLFFDWLCYQSADKDEADGSWYRGKLTL